MLGSLKSIVHLSFVSLNFPAYPNVLLNKIRPLPYLLKNTQITVPAPQPQETGLFRWHQRIQRALKPLKLYYLYSFPETHETRSICEKFSIFLG